MFAAAGSTSDPPYVDGELLVLLKQGAKPAAASSLTRLPGLKLVGVVGQAAQVLTAGSRTAAAAGGPAGALPPGGVVKFAITDGSSVEEKISELSSNPGGCCTRPCCCGLVVNWPHRTHDDCCGTQYLYWQPNARALAEHPGPLAQAWLQGCCTGAAPRRRQWLAHCHSRTTVTQNPAASTPAASPSSIPASTTPGLPLPT